MLLRVVVKHCVLRLVVVVLSDVRSKIIFAFACDPYHSGSGIVSVVGFSLLWWWCESCGGGMTVLVRRFGSVFCAPGVVGVCVVSGGYTVIGRDGGGCCSACAVSLMSGTVCMFCALGCLGGAV